MMAGHILLVDDDELLCDVLADFLELSGYRVAQAGNGRQALECLAAAAEPFDLIVLDLLMPEMDGIRFLRALEDHGKAHPRVLVLSASATAEVVHALDFPAVAGVVRKPVQPPALLATIAGLLASGGAV